MSASEGSAKPKLRRKKAQRRVAKVAAPGEHDDADDEEEDINPGVLLRDFVEDSWTAEAAGQKAAKSAAKGAKKSKRRRPAAELGEDDEEDLLSFGQSAVPEDAGPSAKLIGAISAASSMRAGAVAAPRHAEEALPENEFHAGTGGENISVEDLLAPLADSTGFGDVKKLLQGMSKKEAMPEPLNEVKQGREEREARYKVSSNDIGKFIPQVVRMRKEDQVALGEVDDKRPNSMSALVGNFRNVDDFEKELEEVTKAAGATEAHMIDHKGLPMNNRIRDQQQTQKIARLKALMLREQQTNKRIKKIKSKAYHRIHRKAETREREVLLERLERENPEMAKSLRQDYEKKHAERRMGRQRNARQKWARTMQRFAKGDDGAGQEITKQAQTARDEDVALKRVVAGRDAEQSDDSEAMDLSDSDGEGGGGKKRLAQRTVDKAKQLTLNELNSLKKDGDLPTTGIFGLGFMRNAIKQKREDAKKEAKSVLQELEGLGARLDGDDARVGENAADSDDEKVGPSSLRKGKAAAPERPAGPAQKKREFTTEELEKAAQEVDVMMEQEDPTQSQGISVSGALTVRGVEAQAIPELRSQSGNASSSTAGAHSKSAAAPSAAVQAAAAANPWLASASEENPWMTAASSGTVTDAATPSASSAPMSEAKKAKLARGKGAAAASAPGARRKRKRKRSASADVASEGEAEQGEAPAPAGAELLNVLDSDADAARQQRDLVRATFVEGTQAEDFDEEKEEKQREEEEKNRPVQMLGWGSWTGAGVKARPAPKIKPKAKAESGSRYSTPKPAHVTHYEGDAAVKAQAKYFVDKVPYPFKNPQQYDQEMRMPTGPEWNTLSGHLQRVKPKIFTKLGVIVPPLQHIKNLPPEQADSAMKTWASSKHPKRLKARF